MRKFLGLTLLLFVLWNLFACGADDRKAPIDYSQTVIHPAEVPSGAPPSTVKNSYIVMFREDPSSIRLGLKNFFLDYKFHYNLLAERQ